MFDDQPRSPKCDRGHAMCQYGKERRFLKCVICPAFAGGAPQFEVISQTGTCEEGKECKTMIGWCKDKENTQDQREPGKGLVKGWGNIEGLNIGGWTFHQKAHNKELIDLKKEKRL